MVMPYARIVPMQVVIVSGLFFSGGGTAGLLLFGTLKTLADAAMHTAEHYLYKKGTLEESE